MKRNSLMSTNLKDYSSSTVTKSPIKEYSSYANHGNKNQMVKEFWDRNSQSNIGAEDYMNGFPWPPRSYTCSFCRKEFKSAQALGGHMNVHRRDKARLRQSPPAPTDGQAGGQGPIPTPMLNLNLNPTTNNPNFSTTSSLSLPSSSSSLSSANLKPVSCTLPLFVSPTTPSSSQSSAPPSELKTWVVMDGILLNPLSTKTSEPTKSKIAESLSGCGEYGAFAREDGCKMLKKAEILRMDMEIGLPSDYDLDLELRLGTYS